MMLRLAGFTPVETEKTFAQVSRSTGGKGGMRSWITNYVEVVQLQQNKNNPPFATRTTLYRIPTPGRHAPVPNR